MIRHAGRGVRLGTTASSRRPFGVLDVRICTGMPHRRQFHGSCCTNAEDRFFYPSRPDFLPTRSPRSAASRDKRRSQSSEQLRRFTPLGDSKVCLVPPMSIDVSHAALYAALAEQASPDTAWLHFTQHLRDLAEENTTPIMAAMFDSLFWHIASKTDVNLDSHSEMLSRVQILSEYSVAHGGYGLTRLELHRTVYLWTSLWEQSRSRGVPFASRSFAETIMVHLHEVATRLVSRVVVRLADECDSHEKLQELHDVVIDRMARSPGVSNRRKEEWTTNSSSEYSKGGHFDEVESAALDSNAWHRIVIMCARLSFDSPVAKALGLLSISNSVSTYDASHDIVTIFLRRYCTNAELYAMLPEAIQDEAMRLETCMPPILVCSPPVLLSNAVRLELVGAIAFALANRLDYRVALLLHDSEYEGGKVDPKKRVEVLAAAIDTSARLSQSSVTTQEAVEHLLISHRLFIECKWYESRQKEVCSMSLIRAFWYAITDEARAAVLGRDRWLLLLRQFTTVLVTHDSDGDMIKTTGGALSIDRLLHLHIRLRDYAFAKRLFLIDSIQLEVREPSTTPFLLALDFKWLFQAALEREADLGFPSQLFIHWTTLIESEEFAHFQVPSSLLRMYVRRLMNRGSKHALQLLVKHFDPDPTRKEKQKLHHPNQALRMVRTLFHGNQEFIESSIQMASMVIEHVQTNRSGDVEHILLLYSIALDRSTRWIDVSDTLFQSRVLSLFHSYQTFFHNSKQRAMEIVEGASEDYVRSIYRAALAVTVAMGEEQEMQKGAEELLQEMKQWWGVTQLDSHMWDLRIEAHLPEVNPNIVRANELFDEALAALGDGGESPLAATTAFKLMVALAQGGRFDDADRVWERYREHAAPLSETSHVMMEGAQAITASMRGRDEASLRLLEKLEERGNLNKHVHPSTGWVSLVREARERLQDKLLAKEDMEREKEEGQQSDADRQRAVAFGKLASGQRCRHADEG